MSLPVVQQDAPEFSLVLGGPLFHMYRRAHLSGSALEFVGRRALCLSLVAWAPLALLAALEGHLLSNQSLAFLRDVDTHVRFLVALPVFLMAELVVHQRIRPLVRLFVERRVVAPEDMPKFRSAIEGATRARDSIVLETALLVFVYTVGHWIWRQDIALGTTSWYATAGPNGSRLTLAGYWMGFVSIPIVQFILLRWYLRLGIWFVLLWRISRLKLRLLPTHADRAGGIGFLGKSSYAFSPILFAQGTVLAGLLASRILYQGENLMSFKVTVAAVVGFFVLMIMGPLIMFSPHLARTKRTGLREYGTLATTYAEGFDQKWIRGGARDEEMLGTSDIQSLADLANGYSVVREMHLAPFALDDVTRLAAATALPLFPLLLTAMPLDELVTALMKIIF
jgi:hypothetical protein